MRTAKFIYLVVCLCAAGLVYASTHAIVIPLGLVAAGFGFLVFGRRR